MSARWHEKSLVEKLGIRESFRIIILNAPEDYDDRLGKLPRGVFIARALDGPFDLIHFFTKKMVELENKFPILKQELSKNGALWISWPKSSSRVETDLNENAVRETGLKNGLVDVKIVAVDENWSGLKFVYRTKDRKNSSFLVDERNQFLCLFHVSSVFVSEFFDEHLLLNSRSVQN